MTIVALALLAGSSWALGTAVLSRVPWHDLRAYERAALRLTAGLGLTALLLSLMALAGWFSLATPALGALTAASVVLLVRAWRTRTYTLTRDQKLTAEPAEHAGISYEPETSARSASSAVG